ncbi:uncharacterized protein PRD47_018250 isoform 2-T2 [Ara ararauna]
MRHKISSPQPHCRYKGESVACSQLHSFSSRFLHQILQLSSAKYLLKILRKASAWIGFGVPVETIISKVYPLLSPRPRQLAKKPQGRLMCFVLSIIPTRIQNILGYQPVVWDQSNVPKEIQETLINSSNKANKRKWDDVNREEEESLLVELEGDLLEDDSKDLTYKSSDVETDSEEYESQNDTEVDLEFEEQDGIVMLKESLDLQSSSMTMPLSLQVENIKPADVSDTPELLAASTDPGPEDPAVSSSEEEAPNVDSGDGDTQKLQADMSSGDGSGQEADAGYDDSSSLSNYGDKQEN